MYHDNDYRGVFRNFAVKVHETRHDKCHNSYLTKFSNSIKTSRFKYHIK